LKAKSFYLQNELIRSNAISYIEDIECDGKTKVTISNAGSKSSKQRGLQWRWYADVAKSGKGNSDLDEDVDLECKWIFARPILLRDDDWFRDLFTMYMAKYKDDPERIKWFTKHMIHTESFNTSQMAEYLDGMEKYYISHDIPLTDPREYGLKRAA